MHINMELDDPRTGPGNQVRALQMVWARSIKPRKRRQALTLAGFSSGVTRGANVVGYSSRMMSLSPRRVVNTATEP